MLTKSTRAMKQNFALLFLFLFCSVSTLSFANEQDLALSRLKSDLYRLKDEYDIPAMAIIIVDADKILMADVSGLADRESAKPANAETVFRIGSVTKMFTSLAILMLQEDGLLELDMDIQDITPSIPVKNKWRATHPIKIAYLLEHTAGLQGLSKAEFDHNVPLTLEQALKWKVDNRFTHWPPGLHHSYTNVGTGLAEYVIEKVSKQSYASFIDRRIFKPLGMSSANLDNGPETLSYLATGYDTDGHSVIPYWHMLYRAFGAINLRPGDMAPFLQFLINKGLHGNQRLLRESSIKRMETPSTSLAAKSGLKFGYGLGNYTSLRHGLLFHGHGGDADGYLSRLAYNRDTNLAYFVVINTFKNNALLKVRQRIEDFITQGRQVAEPPLYYISEEKLKHYTGVYRSVTQRFPGFKNEINVLIVSLKDGNVLLKSGNSEIPLLPVNDIHFRQPGESKATATFVTAPDGRIFLQNAAGNYLRISD